MRTRNAIQLISDVRSRSDQLTGFGAQPFISDAEILEWLNQAAAWLWDKLTKTAEHYYLGPPNTFATVSNQDAYPLPSDFYKSVGVDVQMQGYWRAADRFDFQRRNDYQALGGNVWTWPCALGYDLWAQTLKLFPMPTSATNVRHYYYPVCPRMSLTDGASGGNSIVDGINGWEVFLVDWAAKKCAERDQDFDLANALAGDLAQTEQRILSMSASRNPGAPPMTRIVRGRWGGMGGHRGRRWGV